MDALFIQYNSMLQNKIYHNFLIEIFKTFLIILFGLSLIALTVRAVSFLDLIVDNGYPMGIYFKYSFLNLFGIAPKFVPLSFLLALSIFIIKHIQDSELIILWTSGVKKIQLVNLFFFASIIVLILYLILSTFITPLALNKSRQLLTDDNLNTFLPTIKSQQFSDSFKGFTFIVEKKIDNEIQQIFLHDKGNNLKNLSSNVSEIYETTVLAENGVVESKKMFLFNGIIMSSKKNSENEIIKFEQLNIDLSDLSTATIKKPKIQETSTITLLECFNFIQLKNKLCKDDYKREIISTLNRRIIIPFYIPALTLICALLLIKSDKIYLNKISIFSYSFIVLLFTELAVRYTGINHYILIAFMVLPLILIIFLYLFMNHKFSKELKI